MDKKELEKLKEREMKLRTKIYNAEQKELKEKIMPEAKKLIGTCFKYNNSYGSGERWWLYSKVISIGGMISDDGVSVNVNEFQKDCNGKINFQKNTFSWRSLNPLVDNWVKISNTEYEIKKQTLINILKRL